MLLCLPVCLSIFVIRDGHLPDAVCSGLSVVEASSQAQLVPWQLTVVPATAVSSCTDAMLMLPSQATGGSQAVCDHLPSLTLVGLHEEAQSGLCSPWLSASSEVLVL